MNEDYESEEAYMARLDGLRTLVIGDQRREANLAKSRADHRDLLKQFLVSREKERVKEAETRKRAIDALEKASTSNQEAEMAAKQDRDEELNLFNYIWKSLTRSLISFART